MPSSFERVFEFLFKYRPLVFEKASLAFAAPWPLAAVLLLAALVALPAILTYRRAGGRAGAADRTLLAGLRVASLLLVLVCLLRPTLVLQTVVPQQSFVGVLLDDSRSLRIADLGAPRRDFVLRAFADETSPLLRALRDRFKLRFFRFSDGAERLPRVGDLRFDGATTDLAAALEQARAELTGVPLSGLVLVSDGADNGKGQLSEALLALKASAMPVYAVGLGRERFERDVELVRVEAPRSVLKGTSFVASVGVAARGFARAKLRLLVEDAGRVVQAQEVVLPGGDEVVPVRLHVTASEPGPRILRFRIAPQEREQVAENNQQQALLQVLDRREKLLYFEGEPRFEPAFLRRAVAEDPNLQLVTLQRTAKSKFLRLDVDDAEELAAGFPKTREELFRYRGVILGSVEASAFSVDQLRMLGEFVSQRGGGLLMLGSERSFAEGGYAGTPLADALPVVLEPPAKEATPRFAALKLEPTPFGASHGAIQLGASEEETAKRYRTLPPLSTTNEVYRVKPGATTLLVGKAEGGGQPRVALAYQRYGRGKSLAFTVQDSWQWRMHAEIPLQDKTHEQLWRQLLRFLVSGAPGPVTLRLPEDFVSPGSTVALAAEVNDDTFLAVNNARVVAHVKDPSGRMHDVPLEWAVEKDGEYWASFAAAEQGLYEVHVEARRGDATLGADTAYFRSGDKDSEFYGAEMRAELLKRIARETGGRFYTPETVAALPEDLSYSGGGTTVVEQKDLWDMPALYLLLVASLCAEWGYRKLRGLA